MAEYNKISVKLSNIQLTKLKTAVKNSEGTTLRINSKTFHADNLPHEFFLTQRQITKLRNNIENNMSTDIKLSKAQIFRQPNRIFWGNLDTECIWDFLVFLEYIHVGDLKTTFCHLTSVGDFFYGGR